MFVCGILVESPPGVGTADSMRLPFFGSLLSFFWPPRWYGLGAGKGLVLLVFLNWCVGRSKLVGSEWMRYSKKDFTTVDHGVGTERYLLLSPVFIFFGFLGVIDWEAVPGLVLASS